MGPGLPRLRRCIRDDIKMGTPMTNAAPPLHIVGLSGSLRSGSFNAQLLRAAARIAPVALGLGYPHTELLVLATGAGSVIFSHVNDGGFWLIKEYFNMTIIQTFKTWTVLETLISLVAFGLTYGLSLVL